jgi:dihydroxyacid dehydratase/phosphogluconate dehydratase
VKTKSVIGPWLVTVFFCRKENEMKSDQVKKGVERAPHRALLKACGYSDSEIHRPLIGIANSVNSVIPGHVHLNTLPRLSRPAFTWPAAHRWNSA